MSRKPFLMPWYKKERVANRSGQEVAEYVDRYTDERDGDGWRQLMARAAPLEVKHPRVDDRRSSKRFTSAILPPYMRRSPSLENLLQIINCDIIMDNK